MKPTLLFATLTMVFASPASFGKSEIDQLRSLVAEQERQIRQLETENARLRGEDAPLGSGPTELINAPLPRPAAAAQPAATHSSYVVKPGDSLERIARRNGTSATSLAKANGLKLSSVIVPGQKLKLPGSAASPSTSTAAATASATSHKVQAGETFFSISKKHGLSTEALIAANPTVKPSALRPGQMIQLAAAAPAPAVASTPALAAPLATGPVMEVESISPTPEKKVRPITVDGEMTYGDFAAKYGTDADRLNALSGLELSTATVLAKGSELYVPSAQP